MALLNLYLVCERFDEGVGQRATPSLDALRLIAVTKNLEAIARVWL